ncbi:mCG1025041 [Mus musculus]|nr:mCG1025041 [Mus musculus]
MISRNIFNSHCRRGHTCRCSRKTSLYSQNKSSHHHHHHLENQQEDLSDHLKASFISNQECNVRNKKKT